MNGSIWPNSYVDNPFSFHLEHVYIVVISSFRCRVFWVNFCKQAKKKIITFLYILNQTEYIKQSFTVRVFVPTRVTVLRDRFIGESYHLYSRVMSPLLN